MQFFPKPAPVFLLFASLAALVASAACARAEEAALPGDNAAIEACLALVQKNSEARELHDREELSEKTGPKGRLAAARDAAPARPESCIGIVAAACFQATGNGYDSTAMVCYRRELAAWDTRLNAAYQKNLKNADGEDVAEGFRKTQRAWIAFRDAACAQPYIVFKGTIANPMMDYCLMDMTARQALWLGRWGQ